ncbi:copper resistance system multicopper oxidase [endosymbiont of Lamellibrachia barhami]|uniref:copper resistance system multicopper oxidase n=1 Tax=endosymbiont of Lamellibrachia barhami TaxID=205975 RepID=UPI00272AFC3E|nr:copper resistance system multicopper oxidase [endosymbiont of Lamellibrachia barhami]
MSSINDPIKGACLTRRRFVQGVAMGGAFAGLGLGSSALAAVMKQQGPETLRGTDFNLTIGEQVVNFTGAPRIGTTVNGSLPAPILRWREGDTVTLKVTNLLRETSSIHWHGIILPSAMDGVPDIATGFKGIKPGETFTYRFPVTQSGTYWYHSHSGFQEQTGLYGSIIIDPREPEPFTYDRDYVVMLSDWTDEDPTNVYAKLKKLSHYYNFNERTHADLMKDIKEKGLTATWNDRKMWNQMRMSQRDLSDVTGYTYTFLTNGQTPAEGWTGLFRKGEKIRLRFINGSAMTFFDVRIPGLKMTVVAADGQHIEPVSVDEFRMGVAETYDVIVEPKDDTAYTIFAQDIARSGYARGTLTPDLSLTATIPEMDPVPNLGHDDMGMNMMNHAGHDMSGMDHSQHQMPDGKMMPVCRRPEIWI